MSMNAYWRGGRRLLLGGLLVCAAGTQGLARAEDPAGLNARFEQVKPLIQKYCFECHSTDVGEGSVDLEQYVKVDDLRSASRTLL